MKPFSRRTFLTASAAAFAAGPVLAAPSSRKGAPRSEQPRSGSAEIVIVGAGGAGIAAARRLIAAGQRVVMLEAGTRVGGRCITDTRTFGVPYDRGAHWIYAADSNALVRLGRQAGIDLYSAPPGQRVR